MELFDKRYVYFMWDDILKDKRCFFADSISTLIQSVNANSDRVFVIKSYCDDTLPFHVVDGCKYRFAYYDLNYDCKRAYMKDGCKIECRLKGYTNSAWEVCENPSWDTERYEYRIKVKELCYVGISESMNILGWTTNANDCKHVYATFDNSEDALKWIEEHKKFENEMIAFENGETIETSSDGINWSIVLGEIPAWFSNQNYRVKPEQSVYATNKHVAEWLSGNNGQILIDDIVTTDLRYVSNEDDSICNKRIRKWSDDEWHEATLEYMGTEDK